MSGRTKSFVALICCLVVVGCSGVSEAPVAEPPAETPAVEVTQEAEPEPEPQPEDPTAASPGESVDPAALSDLVKSAQEDAKTITLETTEKYTLDNLKILKRARRTIDVRDPDHPVGSTETLKGLGEGNVMVFDGDKTYQKAAGGSWELTMEGSVLGAGNEMTMMLNSILADASEAVYVGEDKVGDFATRHYQLKADGLKDLKQWGPVKGNDNLVFDLWLNPDNLPVKLTFDHASEVVKTDKITKEYVVTSLDPVKVSVPDPAKVKKRKG